MKHFKKLIPILLVIVILFTLVGCGVSSKYDDGYSVSDSISNSGFNSSYDWSYSEDASEAAPDYIDNETSNSQKFITTYKLTIETKKYNSAMTDIKDSVINLGGYIESENSYDYGYSRSTNLVLRIPTKNVNE